LVVNLENFTGQKRVESLHNSSSDWIHKNVNSVKCYYSTVIKYPLLSVKLKINTQIYHRTLQIAELHSLQNATTIKIMV